MASSDNLASIEPWAFRPSFADSWISEAFARDTETLTRALQKSISNSLSSSDSLSPLLSLINPNSTPTPTATLTTPTTTTLTPTPTASNVSGSDHETAPKRQKPSIAATGKVSKRKSRASKRSQTTFITADPANFRQMVQQVTGVRFGNVQMSLNPILKPEPQRLGSGGGGSRLPNGTAAAHAYLPTLDTSAFLLDHQHQQQQQQQRTSPAAAAVGSSLLPFQSAEALTSAGAPSLDSDTFSRFPTLESWKV